MKRYLRTSSPDPRDVLGLSTHPRLGHKAKIRLDPPQVLELVVLARGRPRNALLRDVATGELLVRPFRGLTVLSVDGDGR